jgi:hypothetical protein
MHEIRAWMVETMKARNWSPERWAREAGIEGTVITQYLNDPTQAPPDAATLRKLSDAAASPFPAGSQPPMRTWAADFSVFGHRTKRSIRTYSHAWGALAASNAACPEIGFARTRELAEKQISIRRHRGWSGPFEIVETTEETQA